VSGEAQALTGIDAKTIYDEAAKGNITIYKLKEGRLNYVKLRCLKGLAEDLFHPRSKKRTPPKRPPGEKKP
jgi:hypothetical protein